MGWGEVPVAPNVKMNCPGGIISGQDYTFTATTENACTITFTLDGVQASSYPNVTSASITVNSTVPGTHTLTATASIGNSTRSTSCSWSVIPPAPTITLISPSDNVVIDPVGTERTFIASVNPSTPLEFTFDNNPINCSIIDDNTASIQGIQSIDGHDIVVCARSAYGSDTKSWNWIVMGPWIEPKPVAIGSLDCNRISSSNPCDAQMLTTNTVYKYPDGHCQIVVEYNIGACIGSMTAHQHGTGPNILCNTAEITITVSWPDISGNGSSNNKSVTKSLGSGNQTGHEYLNVPSSGYYIISIDLMIKCLAWSPNKEELVTVSNDSVSCSVRIPEEGVFTE